MSFSVHDRSSWLGQKYYMLGGICIRLLLAVAVGTAESLEISLLRAYLQKCSGEIKSNLLALVKKAQCYVLFVDSKISLRKQNDP